MIRQPTISQQSLQQIQCPLQSAALGWWSNRRGVAELSEPSYLSLAPHLQIALDSRRTGAPRFFYVGEQSLAAEMLGADFTPAQHAGEWFDDGGYADSVSGIFPLVSHTGKPALEDIRAPIRFPRNRLIFLHYARLCLPTRLEDGSRTFTVVTSQKSALRVVN